MLNEKYNIICELICIFKDNGVTLDSIKKSLKLLGKDSPESIKFDNNSSIKIGEYDISIEPNRACGSKLKIYHDDKLSNLSSVCPTLDLNIDEIQKIKLEYPFTKISEYLDKEKTDMRRYNNLLILPKYKDNNLYGYILISMMSLSHLTYCKDKIRLRRQFNCAKVLTQDEFDSILDDIDKHSEKELYEYFFCRQLNYKADMIKSCEFNYRPNTLNVSFSEESKPVEISFFQSDYIQGRVKKLDIKFSEVIKTRIFKSELDS